MSRTFQVKTASDKNFVVHTTPPKYTTTVKDVIKNTYGGLFHQVNKSSSIIMDYQPNLVGISAASFDNHYHLVLNPDSIWLTIERGFATHIKENAEQLRSQFVAFDGKKNINIFRDHFVLGQENDWEDCFDEFSEKIGEFIGKKKDLIVSNFSTTGLLERISSEIVLMDAMSKYFTYSCTTCCGIPSVTLEGSVEDWENIRDKTRVLSEFGLEWWTSELLPVLDKIIDSAKGNVDVGFWNDWYNEGGGSGGPYVTGHVIKFFPYLGISKTYQNSFNRKIQQDEFPRGGSEVPFVWDYNGKMITMNFVGGIIGAEFNNGEVRPSFGWGVKEATIQFESYPFEKMRMDLPIHKEEDVGKLKFLEVIDGTKICSVKIEWEKAGLQEYSRTYQLKDCFVKQDGLSEDLVK